MVLSVAINLTLRKSGIEIFQVIGNWQLWKATLGFRGECVYGRNDWLRGGSGEGTNMFKDNIQLLFSF